MAFLPLRDLINDVLTEAGLVPGLAVQQYTEPQIRLAIQRIFDFLLNKPHRWEHLSRWFITEIDPITGLVTGDLRDIVEPADIYEVRRMVDDMPIIRATGREHLYVQGNLPMYWEGLPVNDTYFETRKIRFYPEDVSGKIAIHALIRPAPFRADDDTVPFDSSIIALGAAWYLVQGDGMNAGQAEKLKNMFDIFFADYVSKLGTRDIGAKGFIGNGRSFSVQQP